MLDSAFSRPRWPLSPAVRRRAPRVAAAPLPRVRRRY